MTRHASIVRLSDGVYWSVYRLWSPPAGSCPRCRRNLEDIAESGVVYRRCACGGVFVSHAAFAHMWRVMGEHVREPERRARPSIYSLPCPVCRQAMTRKDMLGIPIDECDHDGLWFDHPELETALMAAALPFHEWLRRFAGRIRDMK
jgi:Zn-finger nucleic acid-binding protein